MVMAAVLPEKVHFISSVTVEAILLFSSSICIDVLYTGADEVVMDGSRPVLASVFATMTYSPATISLMSVTRTQSLVLV